MSDKTRQEFEAWAISLCLGKGTMFEASWLAWQHQQAIIDARDARIKAAIESADEGNAMWTIFRIRDIMEGKQ